MEFMLISIFYTAAAWFQGLYFLKSYVIANICVALYAGYIVCKRWRKGEWVLYTPVVSLFAFIGLYGISTYYGINRSGAVQEALRVIGYLPAFIIGLSCSSKQHKWTRRGIVISAVLVSVIGLIALSGGISIPGALYGQRMQSTFHYANATAVYLLIGIILSLQWVTQSRSLVVDSIAPLVVYILMCGLILTYSRGVWILFGILNICILFSNKFLKDHSYKLQYIYILFIAIAISGILTAGIGKMTFIIILLLGMILCIGTAWLSKYLYIIKRWKVYGLLSAFRYPLGIALMAVIFSYWFIHLVNTRQGWAIPTEWLARWAYYKGAIRLIFDYPLLGVGARGWELVCEQYVGDYVKYVHNYVLQVLCDVGFIGFSFLCIFLGSVTYYFLKAKSKDWYAFAVILAILVHSLMDVSMHFQLIGLIFFICCGIICREGSDVL